MAECPIERDFRNLSHFDLVLPGFDAFSCLGSEENPTEVSLEQTGGEENAILECEGSTQDNQCGFQNPARVAKCDVLDNQDPGDLDPGECVEVSLTVAGEQTGLGAGAFVVGSKAATTCDLSCIAGPSCDPCDEPPPDGDECLTRTLGFWGTHPHLIESSDERSLDLLTLNEIMVCNNPITEVEAGSCESATEALCSTPGFEFNSNPSYVTLVRQLTAAKLNLAATDAVSDGACASFESTYFEGSIQDIIADCETDFCGASKQAISGSLCIEALNEFNESQDAGFDGADPEPFSRPGPALPGECTEARRDRIVIGVDARRGPNGLDCTPD